MNIANEWSNAGNIRFQETKDIRNSDIRVDLDNGGHQSLVGTEARSTKYNDLPTLWLEDIEQYSDDEFRHSVLHEFGHSLGLLHELQNPNNPIHYDTGQVYQYFYDTYRWKGCQVDSFIFTKNTNSNSSLFDPQSIMIYAIPKHLLKNHEEIPLPTKLSRLDLENIRQRYP